MAFSYKGSVFKPKSYWNKAAFSIHIPPQGRRGGRENKYLSNTTCTAVTALLEGTQTLTDDEWDIT